MKNTSLKSPKLKPDPAPTTGGTLLRNGVSLVPVHGPTEGRETFSYEVVSFLPVQPSPEPLSLTITDCKAVQQSGDGTTEPRDETEDETEGESSSVDSDLPEFISLTDVVEKRGEEAGSEEKPEDAALLGMETYGHEQSVPSKPPSLLSEVPWKPLLKGIASPLLRLHLDIVEFAQRLTPSSEQGLLRQQAVDRIEEAVKKIWPSANVQVFGSFASGLYLPTSDVDVVILNSGCVDVALGLKALASALARQGLATNFQVISKARVPIVKFREIQSGYNFDVSFDIANGPEAASTIRSLMDRFSAMRPLTLVLKVFLQQRELNEVYSGGLGSYALSVMIASFLQAHPSRFTKAGLEKNIGILLIDFFRLYGRSLQHTTVGISCRDSGSYFKKEEKGFYVEDRPYLLAIEDPNDLTNDLGRNSYNIMRVKVAFDHAYCQLIAPSAPDDSLLQRILRLDATVFSAVPPTNGHKMELQKCLETSTLDDKNGKSIVTITKAKSKTKKRGKGKKRARRERSLSDDERVPGVPKRKENASSKRKSPQSKG
jgi:non-canonical poly(A) RNA polymerase PAPD5/7